MANREYRNRSEEVHGIVSVVGVDLREGRRGLVAASIDNHSSIYLERVKDMVQSYSPEIGRLDKSQLIGLAANLTEALRNPNAALIDVELKLIEGLNGHVHHEVESQHDLARITNMGISASDLTLVEQGVATVYRQDLQRAELQKDSSNQEY